MPLDTAGPSNEEILGWMQEYQQQKRLVGHEASVLQRICKSAKNAGVDLEALISTVRKKKLEAEEAIRRLRNEVHYNALYNPLVTREAIFDTWSPRISEKAVGVQEIWDAEESGYRAGMHGVPMEDCPHRIGSELHQAYAKWHGRGVEAKRRELGPNSEQASTARARPKRAAEQTEEAGAGTVVPMRADRKSANGGGQKAAAKKKAGRKGGPGRKSAAVPRLAAPEEDPSVLH